ncbi:MAG: serpin family protein [Planctomycetota bacterium]|nr:MAG: serpin family protein [Planctomycetota bacterium]
MRTTKYLLILLIVLVPVGSSFAPEEPHEKSYTEIVVKGNNDFAFEVYSKLADRQEGNMFLSPYSISTALAMTYAGARGRTETQMADVLHFPTTVSAKPPSGSTGDQKQFHSTFGTIVKALNARGNKGAYELTVANALWGQKGYGFLREFLELIEASYGGKLNEVDFRSAVESARQRINAWVEKKTKGKIKDLIVKGLLSRMTRLVLTNAIYFKGNWASQFQEEETRNAPFTLLDGEKIDAPMMNQTGEFKYMETEDFQGLELPYIDEELSMIIFLPKKFDGLGELEKTLTCENLSEWMAKLRKQKVIVSIPKFKMTSEFELAEVLMSMGMTDAFSGSADFSGMNGKRDLFISLVIHKAYVDVNEEGTEAAAATAVIINVTAVRPEPTPVFRADHPFVFVIRDNQSGSILFIGRVMNPKA